jgi:hypothetical protein
MNGLCDGLITEVPGASDYDRVVAAGPILPEPPSMRIAFNPDDVKNGLGRLVLTLVELVRELMERQAMRRIESGSLTDPEIEKLGITFLRLSEQMETLKVHFGLEADDLNLDLGPLGKLLDEPGAR